MCSRFSDFEPFEFSILRRSMNRFISSVYIYASFADYSKLFDYLTPKMSTFSWWTYLSFLYPERLSLFLIFLTLNISELTRFWDSPISLLSLYPVLPTTRKVWYFEGTFFFRIGSLESVGVIMEVIHSGIDVLIALTYSSIKTQKLCSPTISQRFSTFRITFVISFRNLILLIREAKNSFP